MWKSTNIMKLILKYIITLMPLVYMSFIWYLSDSPSDAIINTRLSFDAAIKESLHLVEFGLLYLFWAIAFLVYEKFSPQKNRLSVLIAVVYALADELHQYFVPSRSATAIDLIKDIVGVIIACYIFTKAYEHKSSRLGLLLRNLEDKFISKQEG